MYLKRSVRVPPSPAVYLRWIFYNLTGGRPMVREKPAVIDLVSERALYSYVDKLGRKWLAESAWAWKRYVDDGG